MARLVIFALIVAFCLAATFASPIPDTEEYEEGVIRQKRVTCDVLSAQGGGFSFNHSACALHCLALGRKGGACSNGVCVCRR